MNESNEVSSDPIDESGRSAADGFGIRIDGEALVLPSGCTLPPYCVKMNQLVSESDMVLTNLSWCPNSVGLSVLLGSPALIFAYFVGRDLCLITYGLNRRSRYRNIFFTLAKIVACVVFLAATIYFAVLNSTHWIIEPLIYVSFILFLASVVALFMSRQPLYVVDHRDGMFWIKGFAKEYLEGLNVARG